MTPHSSKVWLDRYVSTCLGCILRLNCHQELTFSFWIFNPKWNVSSLSPKWAQKHLNRLKLKKKCLFKTQFYIFSKFCHFRFNITTLKVVKFTSSPKCLMAARSRGRRPFSSCDWTTGCQFPRMCVKIDQSSCALLPGGVWPVGLQFGKREAVSGGVVGGTERWIPGIM